MAPLPPLLECIPNVSEGRERASIARMAHAITSTPGVKLLHEDAGFDANRTVFTFVGPPASVVEAAKALAREAIRNVDLNNYSGTHPFVGALDVCPFVPLGGLSPKHAEGAALELGRYVGEELGVPVYLYARSATRAEFDSLARVRRGGYAGLAERLRTAAGAPDFGPPLPHPTAGASVIGARDLLIAYNVDLDGEDPAVARRIAARIRTAGPAAPTRLPAVRAIGWYQPERRCAQVSCNLLDWKTTGINDVRRAVGEQATLLGAAIGAGELIGLAPEAALTGVEGDRWLGRSLERAVTASGP